MQAFDRLGVQSVALPQAFGNEVGDVALEQLQDPAEHHRGADPVGVVVAVHGDRFPALDGGEEPLDGTVEVGEARRVVQVVEARVQEPAGGRRLGETPLDEEPGHGRVQVQLPAQPLGRRPVAVQVVPDRPAQRRRPHAGG